MSYLVFGLYFGCMDFLHFLQAHGHHTKSIRSLEFQGRLDILLEKRLSGAAKRLIWEISV
jgi:hypothetical protein